VTPLHLGFQRCFQITDKRITYFVLFGLIYLRLLTVLDLNFERRAKITWKAVKNLNDDVYRNESLFIVLCFGPKVFDLCGDPDRIRKEFFSIFDYKLNLKFFRRRPLHEIIEKKEVKLLEEFIEK